MRATTKKGQELSLRWKFDSDPNIASSFILHELTAYVDGTEVGYIKVSYVPSKTFSYYFPTILHYLDSIRGSMHGFYTIDRAVPFKIGDRNEIDHQVRSVDREVSAHRDWLSSDEIEAMSYDEKVAYIKDNLPEVERRNADSFQSFKDFHVDKPLVDYINVEPEWRRKGIAEILYIMASKKMQEMIGAPLYASGIQTREAEAAWEYLAANYDVRVENLPTYNRPRRYLVA